MERMPVIGETAWRHERVTRDIKRTEVSHRWRLRTITRPTGPSGEALSSHLSSMAQSGLRVPTADVLPSLLMKSGQCSPLRLPRLRSL